jgi:hypothetical protein
MGRGDAPPNCGLMETQLKDSVDCVGKGESVAIFVALRTAPPPRSFLTPPHDPF